jgi:hypothetical protein
LSVRSRLERIEAALAPPPCPTCEPWSGDLHALLVDDADPWRREDGRYCPSCRRSPSATLWLEALLLEDADEALRD